MRVVSRYITMRTILNDLEDNRKIKLYNTSMFSVLTVVRRNRGCRGVENKAGIGRRTRKLAPSPTLLMSLLLIPLFTFQLNLTHLEFRVRLYGRAWPGIPVPFTTKIEHRHYNNNILSIRGDDVQWFGLLITSVLN